MSKSEHKYEDDGGECPRCGEEYNHRIHTGYRNSWPGGSEVKVCTLHDIDWMWVHVDR